MHTLFTLEDRYGLTVENRDGDVALRFDPRKGRDAASVSQMVLAWAAMSDKTRRGEMSREEYDRWRYNYPKYDTTQNWASVPSNELSDTLVEAFKDRLETD